MSHEQRPPDVSELISSAVIAAISQLDQAAQSAITGRVITADDQRLSARQSGGTAGQSLPTLQSQSRNTCTSYGVRQSGQLESPSTTSTYVDQNTPTTRFAEMRIAINNNLLFYAAATDILVLHWLTTCEKENLLSRVHLANVTVTN